MGESMFLFVSGLGGVFVGMALLYVSIRVTSVITDRLNSEEEKDG